MARGQFFVYSNNSAAALSALLRAQLSTAYESLLDWHVLRSLGLKSATFAASPAVLRALPTGYDSDGRTPLPYWHMPYPAMGGLNLQVPDLLTVLRMLLRRGETPHGVFLSTDLMTRWQTPRTAAVRKHGVSCGYGLGIYCWNHSGVRFWGHDGDADGYLTLVAYSPALARGYVIALNSANRSALRTIRTRLEELLGVDASAAALINAPTAVATASVIGTYQRATQRFREAHATVPSMKVFAHEGRLMTDTAGRVRELIAVSPTRFHLAGEGEATVALVPIEDALFLVGDDFGNWRKVTQ